MFSWDRWQEIFETMRRNRLRTLLTGVSVAWGIFMLVLLLGAGTGLRNGAVHDFRDDAMNSIWIWPGATSKPFEGHAVGRSVQLANADLDAVRRELGGVERLTGRFLLGDNQKVSYGDKSTAFDVRSVHPDHRYIENTTITRGRYINDIDLRERRKVAVIGEPVAAFLFGDGDPMGRWIDVAGILYQVVGVFTDDGNDGEKKMIYLPITTAQMAYSGTDRVHQTMFTIDEASIGRSAAIEQAARELLAERHHFSPDDKRALRVRNNLENFQQVNAVLFGIEAFVWVIGGLTIMAGIVGVSNIMLISVKERTREIGVRKAMGATPGSIVGLIVQESVFLTAVFGYAGLVTGVGLLELWNANVPPVDFLRNPQVDLGVAAWATVLLVVFGALAGFFPAWRAARINPVEALRDE